MLVIKHQARAFGKSVQGIEALVESQILNIINDFFVFFFRFKIIISVAVNSGAGTI